MKKIFILLLVFIFALSAIPSLAAQAAPAFTRELKLGDEGPDVLTLQQRLIELGYFQGPADGKFDQGTQDALTRFQNDNNLLAAGILDKITFDLVYSQEARHALFLQVRDAAEGYANAAAMSGAVRYPMGLPMPADFNTNEYGYIQENRFLSTLTSPLSTFAADVDTASYAQLRAKILRGEPIPPDSVRIEEMLNYFSYQYNQPKDGQPFGVTMELAKTPWNEETWLLLIGLQAEKLKEEALPAQNLVFLIDVSGSMDSPDKLPLVKRSFQMLLDQLAPTDTVSIVTYASRDEVLLDGTPARDKIKIMEAIENLSAGGSTAGAAGIQTAYELAKKHKIQGGSNRVILATDGDLNVGVSDEGSLVRLVEEKKKDGIFLSVLGFGDGNYKDNKLEALSNHGDGNYNYIDTIYEARRALVTEIGGTFFTVAKDVKLQVDFNPQALRGYRLIGYEDRLMAAEDFADDQKDGGEIGSGHRVTVLYELVPLDSQFQFGEAESKYTKPSPDDTPNDADDELLTLFIRSKLPDADTSRLYTYPLKKEALGNLTDNLRFAAAVAEVGMLLRDSEWKGSATFDTALTLLRQSSFVGDVYKEEFLYLVTMLQRMGFN